MDCIKDFSNYTIASPEVTPYSGFDYSQMSNILNKNGTMAERGTEIIRNTADSFEGKEFSIFALYDNKKISELEAKIDILSEKLIENIELLKTMKSDFSKEILSYSSVGNEDYTAYTYYADLKDFCEFLKRKNIASSEAQEVENKINEAVLSVAYTKGFEYLNFEKSGGINIYLPDGRLDKTYEYVSEYGINSKWTFFLKGLNNTNM